MEAKLIWITGLSGSGKTTLGREVYRLLKQDFANTVFLDGDTFREVLGNDLTYSPADRLENAKRIHRMCKLLVEQNINVICATMSLYKEIHFLNRAHIKNYFEIFVHCDLEELIRRDQKGLYTLAQKGELEDIVGVNLPYDMPEDYDLLIDNSKLDEVAEKTTKILNLIRRTI